MADEKQNHTLGDKIAAANAPLAGQELAAAQRADRVRALEEELEGYKRSGKTDRAQAVEAELKAAKGTPRGRQAPTASRTETAQG